MFKVHGLEDRAYWTGLAGESSAAKIIAGVEAGLDAIPERAPMPTAADYLAARRSNDRDRVDKHWQYTRTNISKLVVHRLVSGMGDADDRLLNWLFDATFEPSWTVSAHLPKHDLPLAGRRQMDLAGCEMAAQLAEAREALLPWMRAQTQTLDESIVREIDRRCLTPLVQESPEWWANPDEPQINNWSGVCGGALVAATMSLEAQGLPRPEAKKKAIDALNMFLRRAFTESGECDEGPGYWSYGMAYACIAMSRFTPEELEDNFDMARVRQVASYLERAHIFGNRFYAGNDSVPHVGGTLGAMATLVEITGSEFLKWLTVTYPGMVGRTVGGLLRDLAAAPIVGTWKPAGPAPHPAEYLPDQQVAIFQRPGGQGLVTFTLAGGHNGESHNHNDLGAFQVIIDDKEWILDLGQPHYTTDFFSSARYDKYIVAASSGHCCPAVNGFEQRTGSDAAGRLLSVDLKAGMLSLDLTSAYPAEAGLAKWERAIASSPGCTQATITDRFSLSREGVFTHRIWFAEKPTVAGNTITCGPVQVMVSQAPAQARVLPFVAGDPRLNLRQYPPERELYRVELDYRAAAGQQQQVDTQITVRA